VRNAASVLPEPVGAAIKVFSPRRMARHPSSCASVGGRTPLSASVKRVCHQRWMTGWKSEGNIRDKCRRASVEERRTNDFSDGRLRGSNQKKGPAGAGPGWRAACAPLLLHFVLVHVALLHLALLHVLLHAVLAHAILAHVVRHVLVHLVLLHVALL